MKKLVMSMVFQIEAKSEKSKENIENKITKQLENVLGKLNIFLQYDQETNSFSYVEENIKESFDKKAIFLLKILQHFGYAYVVTGNLENKQFDVCTSKTKISGVCFIQGLVHYIDS